MKQSSLVLAASTGVLLAALGHLAPAAAQGRTTRPVSGVRANAPTNGRDLFAYHCAQCHAAGPGHPGTAALQMKYQGDPPALLTQRKDLDADAIRLFVRNGVNAMPYFRKTEITDADLDKIAAYVVQSARAQPAPARKPKGK